MRASKSPDKSDARGQGTLGRILVLEDDAVLALALEDALNDGGAAAVVIFSRADEALAELKRKRPDVLILDVHLADRDDGWAMAELATMLGSNPPQIIFSTGSPKDIPADIAKLGTVFEKPYDMKRLVAAIRSAKPAGRKQSGILGKLRGAIS